MTYLIYHYLGALRPVVIPMYREVPVFIIRNNMKTIMDRLNWLVKDAKAGDKLSCFCKNLRDVQGAITRSQLLKRFRASLKHEGYSRLSPVTF